MSCVFTFHWAVATMSTRIPKAGKILRKQPQQARSRSTVAAILEAGTHVLGRKGWAGFTTNEVAAAAGVSIGSLYQYFPNKLSLAEAIRASHFDEVLEVLRNVNAAGKPLAESAENLVRGMFVVHGSHPALHRALLEEVPRGKGSKAAHAEFESEYSRQYQELVAKYCKRSGARQHEIEGQVLSAAIEGVVHHAAQRGEPHRPELARALVHLIRSYLR